MPTNWTEFDLVLVSKTGPGWLRRYEDGDYAVWKELCATDATVLQQPAAHVEARAVASLLMKRARVSLEALIERTSKFYRRGGLISDTARMPSMSTMERKLDGVIPLAFRAFWSNVHGVALGNHQSADHRKALATLAPDALESAETSDFLMVRPANAWLARQADVAGIPVSPDAYAKDGMSGADPVLLPLDDTLRVDRAIFPMRLTAERDDLACVQRFDAEHVALGMVDYLRVAVLEYGGYPGLAQQPSFESHRQELIEDLPRF